MKKNMPGIIKRSLSLILCLAMILPLVPLQLPAKAAVNQSTSGSWEWEAVSDSARDIYLTAVNENADMSTELVYDCGHSLSNEGETSYMTIVEKATAANFTTFKAALTEAKFKLRSERTIASNTSGESNAFADFLSPDGKYKLYTYYLPAYHEIRIIVDSQEETVQGYQYTPQTGKTVEPKVVLWGLPQAPDGHNVGDALNAVNMVNYGAMTVILMPDNSLFIHDGGDLEQWSDEGCADFLAFCRKLTGTTTEKMVINTWAISHAHHDHFKGFWRFLYKNHTQFDLKNVMYNIDRERIGDTYDITGAMKLVREVYPEARYYKPHTGEQITIAGVTLDILYTQEDRFVPDADNNLAIDDDDLMGGTYRASLLDSTTRAADFNDTSTVMKFTFNPGASNETDALLYADLTNATAILMEVYAGSVLSADIVSVPHHGQNDQSALMTLAKNGGAKVFFQYQHKGLAYGGDNDLTKQDMYGTFVTKVRNNFKAMFSEMNYAPGSETANYQVFWAGVNTVTVDMNKLFATTSPRTATNYYASEPALTYEYTGWDVMDDTDYLISTRNPHTNDKATVMEKTPDFNLELVTNGKLYSNNRYVIRKKDSDYIMSYSAVANTPGTPNRATSLKVVHIASETATNDPNYYATDPGPVVYSPDGKTTLYMNHSYRDQTLWILTQRNNANQDKDSHADYNKDVAKDTDISTSKQAYSGLFGGKAYTHVYFWKGADNGNYWYAPNGQDGNDPATQYRYMFLKHWNRVDEDGESTGDAKSGRGWMTTSVAGLQENDTNYNLKRYIVEYMSDGSFLIYWRNGAGSRVHFLACDEYGNWGEKIYTDEGITHPDDKKVFNDLYPNVPDETTAEGRAELEKLKVNLYRYNEFSTSTNTRNLMFSGVKDYNVEQGITKDQVARIIEENIKLWQYEDDRRDLPVPCSGWEPKLGYYYLDLKVPTFDTSGNSYSQFDVDIRYVQDGKAGQQEAKSFATVTFYLYERKLSLTGTKTYTVPMGTSEGELRNLIINGDPNNSSITPISVTQSFSNVKGTMSQYMDTVWQPANVPYSAIPEAGKYYLEFVPSSNGSVTYLVNVNYRRAGGADILVGTLSIIEDIEFVLPEMPEGVEVLEGFVAKNAGVAATVFDAEGNPITFQVNGQEVELTLGMLSDANGRFVDTSKEATYTDLIVKYRGQQVKGGEDDKALTITLNVTISDIAQDKPQEGEPGYVGPNKKVASSEAEFLEDGVGNVQLSAYGIPFEKGVDIILVLDLSGSMRYGMDTNTHAPNYKDSRMYNMEQSLQELLKTLQKSGADVRVAMSDFGDLDHYEFDGAVIDTTVKKKQFFDANYSGAKYSNTYEFSNHLNYIFAKNGSPLAGETERQDKPFGQSLHIFNKASHRYTGGLDPNIYTGSGEVGVEAFVDVSTLYNGTKFTSDMGTIIKQLDENVQKGIGTNYDVGLEYAYHLGYAIRQDNIAKGEDREIICIFMSDGAPMQYNYFTGHSSSQAWAEWIAGTVDEVDAETGKETGIQTITYTETNAPTGLSEMKTDMLNLLKEGKLVRPEYQREYWTGWVYNQKTHAENEDKNNRTRAYDLTNGYFLYRERYADDSAVTFFDFMNYQGYELDWDYLCRIAWANGIPEFDYEYYQKNPNLPELVDLLTKGAGGGVAEYLGYERVNIKNDAGEVTGYDVYKVRRSRLIDPGLSEQQYFPKCKETETDIFAAFRSLGIEDSWDYFTQVAYKNRDNLSSFISKMGKGSAEKPGQEALTAFVNKLYTAKFDTSVSKWGTLSPYAYFYNKEGKNWWAEAIKGDPTKLYPVINKYAESGDSPHPYNGDAIEFDITGDRVNDRYISGFQGLGIDIYGILFASAGDGETDSDSSNDDNEDASAAAASGGTNKGGTWDNLLYVPPIMQAISSNNGSASGNYYFLASNQEQLTNAFKSIAGTMTEAATKAYYTDTIGKNYDLFYGQVESTKTPAIKVMHYNLDHEAMQKRLEEKKDPNYKPKEGEKEDPTIRDGQPIVMEIITFETDANGKLIKAHSSLIDNGKPNILLENGLIQGRYVIYNTNTDKSVNLYLDNSGKPFSLKPETFFWIIGNIGATEVVLDYQVYLLGSVDNTLNTQGTTQYFDTNEEATLNYIDYLGNDSKYEFEKSPHYPWLTVQANSMNVSKSVEETNASDKFKLTLEAFGTGTTIANAVSNPLDIVLVLDQSASMYTPAGIDAESISINNMTQVRQQLKGKEISFSASNKTIQENAKNLGYYVAVHKTSNYIYIVQYAEYAAGKWGWFYIPVDETTRTVELNTQSTYTDTDKALALGKKNGVYQPYGYGTYAQRSKAALTNVSYYKTQYGELYDTLQDFVTELKDVSVSSGLNHRVAVVGFASPYYDQIPGSEGTGIYVNGEYNIFKNTADEFYSTALVDVRENYDSVLNSVKAYKANYQQTCPSIGITIAQSIFGARKSTDGLFTTPAINDKLNPASPTVGYDYAEDQEDEHLKSTYTEDNDENRDEIIILFTDGMPTIRCSSVREMGESKNHAVKAEFWSEAGGLDDVIDHAYDAKQAGIEIYCIGTSDAVVNQDGLKSISSDDPTAQSKLTITETWVNDSQGKPYVNGASASAQIIGSTYEDRGYTMYTSDANMDLSKAFDTVYESIINTVELTETAVVKEVVSDYFDLSSVDPADIKVYTVDYLGNYESGQYKFSDTRTLLENAQVTITSSDESDRLDTILVSGFSYKDQYVGMVNQKPVGKKLIIELEIQVKDEFWGGKNVPTNEGTTGVYTPEGAPVIYFPIPETNVQFKELVQPDTVVVDYGLPVSIDVAGNDTVSEKAEITPTGIHSAEIQRPEMSFTHNELFVGEVRTEHGVMTRKDNKLHYAPSNMSMDQSDSFIYEMKFTAEKDSDLVYGVEGNTLYQYADVTVIPASSIYYEDNFVDFSTYTYDKSYNVLQVQSGGWTQVSEAMDRVQAQDHPGADLLNKIDANNVYGYDQAYGDVTTYSNGSAHKIRVYNGLSGIASFTFTGTGFDVIGLTSNTTGTITVAVTNSKGEFVAGYMVDSYYGYSFVDGKWVANPEASNSLYQVPVIKVDLSKIMTVPDDPDTDEDETQYISYGYDTYTVEIDASYAGVLDHGQCQCNDGRCTGCYEFYLDAIRVYNPAGFGGSNSQQIQDAYVQDGEGWPVYQELRNMFVTQKELGAVDTQGVIFIDGKEAPEIKDYRSYGPNNEVYLAPGQNIAFTLNALNYVKSFEQSDFDTDLIASIQLGLRGINALGQVTVKGADAKDLTFQLSATDMFYDVTSMMNKVVTITNTGDSAIAITSFKITHREDPLAGSEIEGGVMTLRGLPTVSLDTANTALDILTPEELTDPVLKPKYPALSFEGMVSYNVFFTAEDLGDLNGADLGLAVFDHYDAEGTVETAKDVILGATQIDGLYMVATNGVHAKYLGDTQYFRAFAKKADGTYVYSKMVSYSALDYAKNALEKSSDVKLKQLVVAMLNYGAEAQKFFGYNTDDLMNKDLTAEQQALVSGIDAGALNAVGKVDASKVGMFASTGGFAKKYPAISFKGAFEINYFMAPSNAVDNDMRLYIWNEDTYNNATELTVNNADKVVTMTLENGMYTASSFEIAAKDLDETVYVAAVYESNGQLYCSGVLPYSIAAYCQKPAAEVASLANAAAVYGCAAKEFFGA